MDFKEKKTEHYYEAKFKNERWLYVYPQRKTIEFFAYPDNIVFTEQDLNELISMLQTSDDKTSSSAKQNQSKE